MSTIHPVVPGGALPPYEPWHDGKTSQSIDFADAASRFIQQNPTHSGVRILEQAIEDVKNSKLVIAKWTSPEEYLKEVQVLGH